MFGGSWIGVTAIDLSNQLQEVGTIDDVSNSRVAQDLDGDFDLHVKRKGSSHRHWILVGV